jgi:hypothetical protein
MDGYWANINMFVVGRLAFCHFFNKGLNIILFFDARYQEDLNDPVFERIFFRLSSLNEKSLYPVAYCHFSGRIYRCTG